MLKHVPTLMMTDNLIQAEETVLTCPNFLKMRMFTKNHLWESTIFWGGDCFKHCDKVIVRIWTIETGVQSNRRHMGPLCSKRTNHSGSHKIPTANPTKKTPSSATMNRKLIKCSGCPVNFFRNSGSCTRKFPKKCAGKYRECLVDHSRHLYIYINMSELNLYIVITSSDYCACHREKERERETAINNK